MSLVAAVRSVCEALHAGLAGLSEPPIDSARAKLSVTPLAHAFEDSIGVLDDMGVLVDGLSTAFTAANCPLSKREANGWRRLTRARN